MPNAVFFRNHRCTCSFLRSVSQTVTRRLKYDLNNHCYDGVANVMMAKPRLLARPLHLLRTLCSGSLFRRSRLMLQYDKIKQQYKDYILLFQVGDFYEVYGEDAKSTNTASNGSSANGSTFTKGEVASKTSLRLTRKKNIFMAGFPVRSLSEWQRTLVEAGFQLALCTQVPPQSGEKALLLGRSVVKLITPGTLIEPLDNEANYLLCLSTGPGSTVGLAWIDISTGEFQVSSSEIDSIDEDLERICPSEVLLIDELADSVKQARTYQFTHPMARTIEGLSKSSLLKECHITGVPASWFTEETEDQSSSESGKKRRTNLSQLHHDQQTNVHKEMLAALRDRGFSKLELSAAYSLLHFVKFTQRSEVPYLSPPSKFSHRQHMAIDANTRRALELVTPLHSNTRKITLLGCIDKTVTAAGGRLLKSRLSSPLMDVETIKRRLAIVELFSVEVFHCETIVGILKSCEDLERIIQKVATGAANITDLQAIKSTLCAAGEILDYMKENLSESLPILAEDIDGLAYFTDLVEELECAISGAKYGDYIMSGYSDEVDQLRERMKANEVKLNQFVEDLKDSCGVNRLLVAPHKSYVRVLEVSKSQASKAEGCNGLFKIDSTQSKTRFSHIELQKLNAEMQQLETSYSTAQDILFKQLCDKVMSQVEKIKETACSLARLDVSTSLGLLANERSYCKPEVTNKPMFNVKGGVHPVVASTQLSTFVGNHCDMEKHRLWVVTGPNMGGKSTFLRQNALIAVLAQMGSFVPATEAQVGVVDRLFARIGASDNVAKHMSTFHMEMTETANILTTATPRSFVILDEIGRGTSTSEGLCIAQAVVEHLHNKIGCRALVATHFHQLAQLSNELPRSGCYKLVAEKDNGGIIFTYQIKEGHTNHSFAIDVAQLAGIPHKVTARAQELLTKMNEENFHSSVTTTLSCNSNPSVAVYPVSNPRLPQSMQEIIDELEAISLERITPIDALNFLYKLKQIHKC